jgi:hypothetical protein
LPPESTIYLNQRPVLRAFTGPKRVIKSEIDFAPVFFDNHSVLTSQIVLRGWRMSQLIQGLTDALAQWNITMAACAERFLVESACAWFIESRQLIEAWETTVKRQIGSPDDLFSVRSDLFRSATQVFAGTRLPQMLERNKELQRTNVLTFIQKASKTLVIPELVG